LLRNADVAMYRAKERGRNTYQFYATDMTAQAQERLNLESALRRALARNEFMLHYQPIVELADGRGGGRRGVGALVPCGAPSRAAAAVHSVRQESGLIVPIGEWVLRAGCAQCVAGERAGLGALRLAVTILPRQFQRPELTESVLLNNPEQTIANMQRLHDMGCGSRSNDFGTGYCGLSYPKRFPIDRLKIVRSSREYRPRGTMPRSRPPLSRWHINLSCMSSPKGLKPPTRWHICAAGSAMSSTAITSARRCRTRNT
jgi:predicted signal transduction protein with EAL and GGDEF domain